MMDKILSCFGVRSEVITFIMYRVFVYVPFLPLSDNRDKHEEQRGDDMQQRSSAGLGLWKLQ